MQTARLMDLESKIRLNALAARITRLAHHAGIHEEDGQYFTIFTYNGEEKKVTMADFVLPDPQRDMSYQLMDAYGVEATHTDAFDNGDMLFSSVYESTGESIPLFFTRDDICIDLYGLLVAFGEDLSTRVIRSLTAEPTDSSGHWAHRTEVAQQRAVNYQRGNRYSPAREKVDVRRGTGRHRVRITHPRTSKAH